MFVFWDSRVMRQCMGMDVHSTMLHGNRRLYAFGRSDADQSSYDASIVPLYEGVHELRAYPPCEDMYHEPVNWAPGDLLPTVRPAWWVEELAVDQAHSDRSGPHRGRDPRTCGNPEQWGLYSALFVPGGCRAFVHRDNSAPRFRTLTRVHTLRNSRPAGRRGHRH